MKPDSSSRLGSAARRRSENLRLEGDCRAAALIAYEPGTAPLISTMSASWETPSRPRIMARIRVTAADGDYYAVIKFDPAKVTPVPNYGGFAINGISPDPNPGQTVCKQGSATGSDCQHVTPFLDSRPERPISRMHASYQSGDDGGR
jgi:hypothetical protein